MENILHDNVCEMQVLGVLMSYGAEYYHQANEYATRPLMYSKINQKVYDTIGKVVENGDVPDIISVYSYIQSHPTDKNIEVGADYLAECISSVASSVTFHQNVVRIADLAKRRQMYMIGMQLMSCGTSEVTDADDLRTKTIEALNSIDDTPQDSIKTAKDAIKELDIIVQANICGTRKVGIPTGFSYLDEKGGLQPTDLWIIAAEFSQGKTSLALDMCLNASKSGVPCVFYSCEMMGVQLAARMLSGQSGISSRTIMQTPMTGETLSKYDRAIGKVEGLPIYFDDSSTSSVERIISSIRTLTRKKGVKVAFVDYLQVLQTNEKSLSRTEEQFFGLTARKFKNLAKELQISIVLISQIARSKDTVEPTLSRIRGSGQIAEAADVVLMIYRPEFYQKKYSGTRCNVDPSGTAQIKLAKGRNIGTGDTIVGFHSETTHFFDLDSIPTITGTDTFSPNDDSPF